MKPTIKPSIIHSLSGSIYPGVSESGITSPSNERILAMYTMDRVSGVTLLDESPHNRNATLVNGAVQTPGHINNAIDVNGDTGDGTTSKRITWATPTWLDVVDTLTISVWAYYPTGASTPALFHYGSGNNPNYQRGISAYLNYAANGSFVVFVKRNTSNYGYYQTAPGVLPPDTWLHYVLMLPRIGTPVLYLNDSLVPMTTFSSSGVIGWDPAPVNADVGRSQYNSGASAGTPGNSLLYVDQMRFIDGPVILSEISELYNLGVGA